MKLVKSPSKIVGVRVGELRADLITGKGMHVKYVLLRDPKGEDLDGVNAGQYTKERDFSEKTMKAFEEFVSCLEEDVLPELFEVKRKMPEELKREDEEEKDDEDRLDFPKIPTLGNDGKPTPQV